MKKSWAEQYNAELKPLTEEQLEYHRKKSAKYIFITNKNGNAHCQRCGAIYNLKGTKHKGKATCPICGEELEVQHTWRMSQYLETINWMVVPKAVNNHVLCLRYVLANQFVDREMEVYEAARMFIDEYHAEPEFYCFYSNIWNKNKKPYFRADCIMMPNRYWCGNAYEYPKNFFKEIDKLDCFKYYSSEKEYDFGCYSTQLAYQVRSARLNEKLSKLGMNEIVEYHRSYYRYHGDRCYPQNYKATDLIGMLKLDKPRFNVLRNNPTAEILLFLQDNKDVNLNNFAEVKYSVSTYKTVNEFVVRTGVSFSKMNKYLKTVESGEYRHYLDNLNKLGYNVKDPYYAMPKDFREADDRITDEYMRKFEKEKLAKIKKQDKLIKKISDGLRKMNGLQEFLNGSDGLLVYVPESSKDLVNEGKALHNCIGTYVERIAEKKTMVFFVRKLNNPTAPFVAFEYYNGRVIQCRYDHNEEVKDTKIINFVNRFAETLRKVA